MLHCHSNGLPNSDLVMQRLWQTFEQVRHFGACLCPLSHFIHNFPFRCFGHRSCFADISCEPAGIHDSCLWYDTSHSMQCIRSVVCMHLSCIVQVKHCDACGVVLVVMEHSSHITSPLFKDLRAARESLLPLIDCWKQPTWKNLLQLLPAHSFTLLGLWQIEQSATLPNALKSISGRFVIFAFEHFDLAYTAAKKLMKHLIACFKFVTQFSICTRNFVIISAAFLPFWISPIHPGKKLSMKLHRLQILQHANKFAVWTAIIHSANMDSVIFGFFLNFLMYSSVSWLQPWNRVDLLYFIMQTVFVPSRKSCARQFISSGMWYNSNRIRVAYIISWLLFVYSANIRYLP